MVRPTNIYLFVLRVVLAVSVVAVVRHFMPLLLDLENETYFCLLLERVILQKVPPKLTLVEKSYVENENVVV